MMAVVPGFRWSARIRQRAVNPFCLRRSFSNGCWPFERRWAARRPSGNERVDLIRRSSAAAGAERRQNIDRDELLHHFLTARGIVDRGLDLGARDAEEPHEDFPVVWHKKIELAPEMASQRGAPTAGGDGEEQITAPHDGGNDKVRRARVVRDAHQDAGAPRIITYLGIHLAVVGGRDHERHPGKILDRVPPFDERQRGDVDEPREGGRDTRADDHDVSSSLDEARCLAGPDVATADDEDPTVAQK